MTYALLVLFECEHSRFFVLISKSVLIFHPKVWIIYIKKKDIYKLKLICDNGPFHRLFQFIEL